MFDSNACLHEEQEGKHEDHHCLIYQSRWFSILVSYITCICRVTSSCSRLRLLGKAFLSTSIPLLSSCACIFINLISSSRACTATLPSLIIVSVNEQISSSCSTRTNGQHKRKFRSDSWNSTLHSSNWDRSCQCNYIFQYCLIVMGRKSHLSYTLLGFLINLHTNTPLLITHLGYWLSHRICRLLHFSLWVVFLCYFCVVLPLHIYSSASPYSPTGYKYKSHLRSFTTANWI